MKKEELEATSGKLTLLVQTMVLVHWLPGLPLAFKEVALTGEYRPAFLISSVRERQGLVLNSLPLRQEPFCRYMQQQAQEGITGTAI